MPPHFPNWACKEGRKGNGYFRGYFKETNILYMVSIQFNFSFSFSIFFKKNYDNSIMECIICAVF